MDYVFLTISGMIYSFSAILINISGSKKTFWRVFWLRKTESMTSSSFNQWYIDVILKVCIIVNWRIMKWNPNIFYLNLL